MSMEASIFVNIGLTMHLQLSFPFPTLNNYRVTGEFSCNIKLVYGFQERS